MSGENAGDRGAGAVDHLEEKRKRQQTTMPGCFWLFILFLVLVVLYMIISSINE